MNQLEDLVDSVVQLFLEYLEALVIVIVLSFLLRLQSEISQRRQELDQQRRQQLYRPRQDAQRQNLQQRYQALRQQQQAVHQRQQRATHQQHPQPGRRQSQSPQPGSEYVNQQEAAPPSSSEQANSESALCKKCRTFFCLDRSGPSERAFPHSETLSVIRDNAARGCSVCAIISRRLKNRPVAADKPVAFTIEPWRIGWHLWSPYIDIRIVPVTDNSSKRTPLHLSG